MAAKQPTVLATRRPPTKDEQPQLAEQLMVADYLANVEQLLAAEQPSLITSEQPSLMAAKNHTFANALDPRSI